MLNCAFPLLMGCCTTAQNCTVNRTAVNHSIKETTLNHVSLLTAQILISHSVSWNYLVHPDVRSLLLWIAESCCILVTTLRLPAFVAAQLCRGQSPDVILISFSCAGHESYPSSSHSRSPGMSSHSPSPQPREHQDQRRRVSID